MPNKTNKELGIYKISVELTPLIKELEKSNELDLRNISHRARAKLGIVAKNTGIIEYVPLVRRKTGFKIISQNPKTILIKKIEK